MTPSEQGAQVQQDDLCTDEELREMLMVDGEVNPMLREKALDGELLVDKVLRVLRAHRSVFAKDPKNPRRTHLTEIDIDTGDAAPMADKARHWAQKEAEYIMQWVKAMLERGHVEVSTSPWACNPVLVQQNDKIRFCVDFRKLNSVTKRDSHGIGNIDDMLQKLRGASVMSTLDLAAGYYQIPLSEDAKPKTAFRLPNGALYQYTVAPFGLVNLPAQFTRLMHQVLGEALGVHAMVYIDDVLIYSNSLEAHIKQLDDVLGRIDAAGMSVARHKCQLFREEVKFLGHIVGAGGARPDPDKVKAMLGMAPPLDSRGKPDKRLVQTVMGCFNYYRRYIKDFSKLAAPIVELTKDKNSHLLWDATRQRAYQRLKEAMCGATLVMHPDFSLPFVLYTDASKTACAGVLTQFRPLTELEAQVQPCTTTGRRRLEKEEEVREVVVGYFSKLNSEQDANMGATALECLAVVLSLNHFRPYIWGCPVTVVTDAAALRWLLTLQDHNGKLLRWAMRVMEYDVTVQHRSGKHNGNADGLSRLPTQAELDAPKEYWHADEGWSDAVPCFNAPPSGVKFADDQHVTADSACSGAQQGQTVRSSAQQGVVRVAMLHGYAVAAPHGFPYRFNDAAVMAAASESGGVAGRLFSMSIAQAKELLEEDDVPAPDCEGNVTLFASPESFAWHADAQVQLAQDGGALTRDEAQHVSGGLAQLRTAKAKRRRTSAVSTDAASADTAMTAVGKRRLAHVVSADAIGGTGSKRRRKSSLSTDLTAGAADPGVHVSEPEACATTLDGQEEEPSGDRRNSRRKMTAPRPDTDAAGVVEAAAGGDASPTPAMLSREVFLEMQRRDAFCQAVTRALDQSELPRDKELAMHLMMCRELYTTEEDGLLLHCAVSKPKRGKMLLQWVTPSVLRPLVLRLGHDDASAAHGGVGATLIRIAERFYWPGMSADVRQYVISCVACQKRKSSTSSQYVQLVIEPTHVYQRVHVDFLQASVKSSAGHVYILVVVDARSGYVWLYATKDKEATTVADILYRLFLDIGSMPEQLISDQGKEFVAAVIADLCRLFMVNKVETSAYHPQANGVAERMNRRVLAALQLWVSDQQVNWHKGLEAVQYALRTSPRTETGLTPYYCVHGREAAIPLEAFGNVEHRGDLLSEIQERLTHMEVAQRVIDEAYGIRRERIEQRNRDVRRTVSYSVGDLVMIEQQPVPGRGRKLDPKYSGPWQLMQATKSGLSFSARMMGRRVRHTIVHVSNMKPFHRRPDHLTSKGTVHARLTGEQLADLDVDEQVYTIHDRRANPNGTWDYRWLRRDGQLSEWVSEDAMLEIVTPWTLDTFHALYELRPESEQFAYAQRPEAKPSAQLERDAALAIFPRGTEVVREHKPRDAPLTYIWGRIDGYLKPYWRARYDDGVWEDMTKTDVKQAVALAQAVKHRAERSGITASQPVLTLVTSPIIPSDFGANYEGEVVRYHSESTGWSRGKLVKYMPRRSKFTFEVLFNGESQPRTVVLRPGYYTAGEGESQPKLARHSAWNILINKPVDSELAAAATEAEPIAVDDSSSEVARG